MLAAGAVEADEIVVYVGGEHGAAIAAIRRAIAERSSSWRVSLRLVEAPVGYVAGEQSAAVHFIETGDARPTTPYRPWERGVRGEPTLVQNVESLAHAALIARRGDAWCRTAARAATPGTALVTVSGGGFRRGVREIELGTPLSEVLAAAGIEQDEVQAVLLGGYFGTWARLDDAGEVPLDPLALRERGFAFGAGVIAILGRGRLRRGRDGADHGLHDWRKRGPVRPVRLRPAGPLGCHAAPGDRASRTRRSGAAQALGGPGPRPGRVRPSRRRRGPPGERLRRVPRRVRIPPGQPPLLGDRGGCDAGGGLRWPSSPARRPSSLPRDARGQADRRSRRPPRWPRHHGPGPRNRTDRILGRDSEP